MSPDTESAAIATAAATVTIGQPGVYDMPDDVYHGDPVPAGSLSSSGARRLLPPSCPALFRYEREHGEPAKKAWDIGSAAHKLVLGVGPELVLVDRERWDTKDCKAEVAAIRGRGDVPLKRADYDQVHAMAARLREHPIAAELLDPGRMAAEQSIFWHDNPTGIWRRARIDALSTPDRDGPAMLVDYKSCRSADLGHISKALHDYGYAMQAAWYLDGAATLALADRHARFLFVFQETTPPYLVTVIEPDATALAIGTRLARQALEIYRDCTAADLWPGHVPTDEIPLVGMPSWVERHHTTDPFLEEIL